MDQFNLELGRKVLRQRLSPHRLLHSEGVLQEAEALAKIHGADVEKARVAGLLHDMTKEFSREEHFRLFETYHACLDDNLRSNKNLWHALSGSLDVTETFGITDPEIISAIRYHTTGKRDMTKLETILFLADAIEPNRGYEDLDFYRALAREDLDKTAYLVLLWTINDLERRNLPIHKNTLEACAFLAKTFPHTSIESEKLKMNSVKGT